MAQAKTHKDVDFSVSTRGSEKTFKKFDEAVSLAVVLAASDGRPHNVDVLIYSAAGARWWGGDDAAEEYEDDPDASVSDRIVIRAESLGRIR